jgi:hypothetical protein
MNAIAPKSCDLSSQKVKMLSFDSQTWTVRSEPDEQNRLIHNIVTDTTFNITESVGSAPPRSMHSMCHIHYILFCASISYPPIGCPRPPAPQIISNMM